MRTIEYASAFKKDFRRVKATPRHQRDIDDLLGAVLIRLVHDEPLLNSCRDHDLTGSWAHCRECHLKPDLLLIYQKTDAETLRLLRLGSHSELFR